MILKFGVHSSLSRKAKLISKVYWKHMSMDYEMDEYYELKGKRNLYA